MMTNHCSQDSHASASCQHNIFNNVTSLFSKRNGQNGHIYLKFTFWSRCIAYLVQLVTRLTFSRETWVRVLSGAHVRIVYVLYVSVRIVRICSYCTYLFELYVSVRIVRICLYCMYHSYGIRTEYVRFKFLKNCQNTYEYRRIRTEYVRDTYEYGQNTYEYVRNTYGIRTNTFVYVLFWGAYVLRTYVSTYFRANTDAIRTPIF